MPSLSNIPGFTALSTSSDPHAAWPDQAGSYNVVGDGTTPLTNPTTSDGNGTGYCAPDSLYVGRGNNSGNVKGCNTIVCYGVWQGNAKASTGWPYNYQRDKWNKIDCLYIFTVNTSTGAITLTYENKGIKLNTNRNWGRSIQNSRMKYITTPGTGSMVSHGYGLYGYSWNWNQNESGYGAYRSFRMNTSGNGTSCAEWNNSGNYDYNSHRIGHCPKTTGGYSDQHYAGGYTEGSSGSGTLWVGYLNSTGCSYSRGNMVSSLSGSQFYATDTWQTQPDGPTGGTGDICGISWARNSNNYRVLQGGCSGQGGSDISIFYPSSTDWDAGEYDDIIATSDATYFQKSGSTFGTWRYSGRDGGTIRPMSNVSTAVYNITPKSWKLPNTFFNAKNSNVTAGICNDQWFSGVNNRAFSYVSDGQEGLPLVKWEIDDTNGAKIVGSVMAPKFDFAGNKALGYNSNPETTNSTQHMFPIWTNSSDTDPSWVVVVFWAGGGDQYSSGTTKGIPGQTQPVLRCYPWPTFTSQNIPL